MYDIAKNLRDKLDAARGATRALVLAVGRERQGLGRSQRQRTRDAVVAARDEAMRESEEDKARLVVDLKAAQEELELVQRQMAETRSAPAARVAQLASLLSAGPAGICFYSCPNSLCLIPQIQPVMLGLCPLCPIMPTNHPKMPAYSG